jgi:putative transposase
VFPGVPHHVTQRGNHRERVFFGASDCTTYLRLLKEQADFHELDVVAYCLMPNHVHLVVVPPKAASLHRALKAVNGHYAQHINRTNEITGHLWQGRYFSSPLDATYLLNAVRYVELNPVRAGMAAKAEEFEWSSAGAHCGIRRDPLVDARPLLAELTGIADWSRWLADGVADDSAAILRLNGTQNLPCGSSEFIAQLEARAGRTLRYRPRGASRRNDLANA